MIDPAVFLSFVVVWRIENIEYILTPHSVNSNTVCCHLALISDASNQPKGEKIGHEQQMKFFGKVSTVYF